MRRNLWIFALVVALFASLASGALRAGEQAPEAEAARAADVIEIMIREPLVLSDFLKAVGLVTGTPFVWDPHVRALEAHQMQAALNLKAPRDEVFQLVRALLASFDLGIVQVGPSDSPMYRVVELSTIGSAVGITLKPRKVELTDENAEFYAGQDGLYVTTVVPVEHLRDLDGLLGLLSWISTGARVGNVAAVSEVRAYVVTDFAPVAVRLRAAILDLDERAGKRAEAEAVTRTFDEMLGRPGERASVWTHVMRLENVAAEGVAQVLRELLAPSDGRTAEGWDHPVRIAAHEETNSLVSTATPRDFDSLKRIIEALDVAPPAESQESAAEEL